MTREPEAASEAPEARSELAGSSESSPPGAQRAPRSVSRDPETRDPEACGPQGCMVEWLTSERVEIDDDPVEFMKLATDAGWGDGLPLIPATEERVRAFVAA